MNLPSLQGNYVDLVIIAILLYFASQALRTGLWIILVDFISFLLSLLVALRGYSLASNFLRSNFSLTHSLSNALGFLAIAVLSEGVLSYVLTRLVVRLPNKLWKNWWSKALAIIPSVGEGVILVSFILIFSIGLPISPDIKSDILGSKIGGFLVHKTQGTEAKINEIFGGVIEDSLTYLTVKPGSTESVAINVESENLQVDESSEREMFEKVNSERRSRGLQELSWRGEVVGVARDHARDMWKRGYFGHVSPDGKDVGDRLTEVRVNYFLAGENLALAPGVDIAHQGLMNSEGHRENILEPRFKQMAVGVVDNGVYGKMFVQVFTD